MTGYQYDEYNSSGLNGRILKYHLTSLGCAKNLVESEEMMAKLSLSGMVLVNDPEEADLLVVNTCGFINPAKEESIGVIFDLAEIRERNPHQRLVVVGCMVERYRKELTEEMPEVDAFIGVHDKETFVNVAWEAFNKQPAQIIPPYTYTPRLLTTPPHLAYLRISDGCSHTCSFCAIPQMRGKLRSRPMDEIVEEAASLARGGVKELVIVSQDSSSYGVDRYGRYALPDLLLKLDDIDGLEWIRVMYAYPHLVDRRIAHCFAACKKLVPYLDMPIQHGDPEILKLMKRGSDDRHIRKAVELVRNARSDMTIRTTVIVGFPGEKRHHFQHTIALLDELKFDRVGVFKFSREEGTPSAELPNQVSGREIEKRYYELVEWLAKQAVERNRRYVGEIVPVLIERRDSNGDGYWGRIAGQAPEVDGQVHAQGAGLIPGHFAPVRITHVDEENLFGVVNIEVTAAFA